MNYFTEEEALKIQSSLKKFIGQKMKYSPDEDASAIIDVQALPTKREIAHYGEIQYGHIVNIVFEKHSGLVPALFCSFNGMDPIYATHEELTPGRKNQILTSILMYGKWVYKHEKDQIEISISKEGVKIVGVLNESQVDDSLPSSGHWYSNYDFIFTDKMQYHIRTANKNEMIFGKLQQASLIDGNFQWQKKLTRV